MKKNEILKKVKDLAEHLDSKKATNIVVLDVIGKSDITDYFVLASGNSHVHVTAIATYAKHFLDDLGLPALHREGVFSQSQWVVVDFGVIILHVFTDDIRTEYNLESVWGDAKKIKWEKKIDKATAK